MIKDLKVYYKTEDNQESIDSVFDKTIERIAKIDGLVFSGSGVELETGIRDIHYIKKGRKK